MTQNTPICDGGEAVRRIGIWLCLLALAVCYGAVFAGADDMPQMDKTIYLTFDDGPSIYTPRLLKTLARYDAKATFFLVDTPQCTEEMLQAMVAAGHSLGVHSLSHDFKTIYSGEDAFLEDLYAMQNVIREKSGITTTLMRFPGGSSNTVSCRYCRGIMSRLVEAVTEAGFCYFDWNVDSGDAAGCRDTEQLFQNVISGIQGREQAVVLLHDVYSCSVQAVERILIWGKNHGYQFRALTPQSENCHHEVQN